MFTLLTNLLKKFIKKKLIFHPNGELKGSDLLEVDVLKASNHKALNLVEIGTKAKLHFSECTLLADKTSSNFRAECLKFYCAATSYLMKALPVDVSVIKYAQYLHHNKRNASAATSGISNLALKVTQVRHFQSPLLIYLKNWFAAPYKC